MSSSILHFFTFVTMDLHVTDLSELGRNVAVVGLEVVVLALAVRLKLVHHLLYLVLQLHQVLLTLGLLLNQSIMLLCYFLFKPRNDWMFLLLLFTHYFYH